MFDGARSMRFATARVAAATLVIGLATFVTVLPAQVAGAADDVVSACAGSGPGSLPAVVGAAASGDTITFSVTCPASSPITLASTIGIGINLTIDGPGANDMVVSGNNAVEVFDVASGVTDTFSGLTIENGNVVYNGNGNSGGGGIYNSGSLTIVNSTLSNNTASVNGDGGAIFNNYGTVNIADSSVSRNSGQRAIVNSLGTINITDSSVSNNSVSGIYNAQGTLTVTDSSISDNTTPGEGGGIQNGGGDVTISDSTLSGNDGYAGAGVCNCAGTMTITDSTLSGNTGRTTYPEGGAILNFGYLDLADSTISDNTSGTGGGIFNQNGTINATDVTLSGNSAVGVGGPVMGDGGGLFNYDNGTLNFTNSTLSNNSADTSGGGIYNVPSGTVSVAATIVANSTLGGDCYGTITDAGYNLDDDGSCGFSAANGSESGVDPDLGPLQNNGGPTDTQAPALGSPVLNRIPLGTTANGVTLCPGTDQRGVERPQGSECDIGAVELVIPKAITSPNSATTTAGSHFSFPVTTSGSPVPKITEKGALPKRLTFTDNADGTATISGKTKMTGVYHLTITATFGIGTNKYVVSQAFTLTVDSG